MRHGVCLVGSELHGAKTSATYNAEFHCTYYALLPTLLLFMSEVKKWRRKKKTDFPTFHFNPSTFPVLLLPSCCCGTNSTQPGQLLSQHWFPPLTPSPPLSSFLLQLVFSSAFPPPPFFPPSPPPPPEAFLTLLPPPQRIP